LLAEHEAWPAGATSVDELVVFSSELDRSGPTYEPMAVAPLAG
jgi:2'-5' RNA ligase